MHATTNVTESAPANGAASPTPTADHLAVPGEEAPAARPLTAATVTALHLTAFRALRDRTVPLTPVTLLSGPSGSGKSAVLEAYEALARLGGGEVLGEVFGRAYGGPGAYVPRRSRPDGEGRRGFRIGCTVDGPAGPLRFDLAVQAEPELRIAGERLSVPGGRTLLSTALRDPSRRTVEAEWHSGAGRVTRARLPDDRLATALLPLRVGGGTEEEHRVLAAAEQAVVALRSVFACDPRPETMREPVSAADTLLRGGCDNLAAVLRRTRTECAVRHGHLVGAVRAGFAGPVADLVAEVLPEGAGRGRVRAVVDRGCGPVPPGHAAADRTPLEWLGDGELRYAALALVLLTGPGVLSMDPVQEVLPARQAMTVLADGLDRGLDGRQTAELTALAERMGERGHVRLLASVSEAGADAALSAAGSPGEARQPGVSLVDLGRE
ncbi:AAA family ATPase [Streptomyces winkii]|uniref:AAA family ATPase n=1 Tax=Streptomyces winkii TaxID=3051178 RepID=UPI0028D8966A|nr:ATP-binding protein [Streptomyces sp. DSM 40971]